MTVNTITAEVIKDVLFDSYKDMLSYVGNPVLYDFTEEQISTLKHYAPDIHHSLPLILDAQDDLIANRLTPMHFLELATCAPKPVLREDPLKELNDQNYKIVVEAALADAEIRSSARYVIQRFPETKKGMLLTAAMTVVGSVVSLSPLFLAIAAPAIAAMLAGPTFKKKPLVTPFIPERVDVKTEEVLNESSQASDEIIQREQSIHQAVLQNSDLKNIQQWRSLIKNMRQQANTVANDKTPFIYYGAATGVMQNRGSLLSPDPGARMGVSLNDFFKSHGFIFGQSGSGKTQAFMAIMQQLLLASKIANKKFGSLIFCEKGALPFDLYSVYKSLGFNLKIISDKVYKYVIATHRETEVRHVFYDNAKEWENFPKTAEAKVRGFANLPDYTFKIEDFEIEREETSDGMNVALIEGVPAKEIGPVLNAVMLAQGGEAIWSESSGDMIQSAAYVVELCHRFGPKIHQYGAANGQWGTGKQAKYMKWTIENIAYMVKFKEFFHEAIQSIHPVKLLEAFAETPIYKENIKKLNKYFEELATGNNGQANSIGLGIENAFNKLLNDKWIRTFLGNETGVNVLEVCRGEHVGVAIPPSYGIAGQTITALLRMQLQCYRESKAVAYANGSLPDECPVLQVHDEVHMAGDIQTIPERIDRFRSFGISLVYMTQTVEAIIEKLLNDKNMRDGENFVGQLFSNAGSIITFNSSKKTFDCHNDFFGALPRIAECKHDHDTPIGMYYHRTVKKVMKDPEIYKRRYLQDIEGLQVLVDNEYAKAVNANHNHMEDVRVQNETNNRESISRNEGNWGQVGTVSTTVQTTKVFNNAVDLDSKVEADFMKEKLAQFRKSENDEYVLIHRGLYGDYPRDLEELKNDAKLNERVINEARTSLFFTLKDDKLFSDEDQSVLSTVKQGNRAVMSVRRGGQTYVHDVIEPVQYWRDSQMIQAQMIELYGKAA